MRTRLFTTFLIVFLCGAFLTADAQSPPIAAAGLDSVAGASTSGWKSARSNAIGMKAGGKSNAAVNPTSEASWTGGSEATCYAMRSYLVKRESPKSDVTSLVGYSTCLPSRNIELKRSEFNRGALNGNRFQRSGLSDEFGPAKH